MLLQWESSEVLTGGELAAAYQDKKGKLQLIYVPPGSEQLHSASADVPLGNWEDLDLSFPQLLAPDKRIESLNLFQQPDDNMWLVWISEGKLRFAVDPDNGEIYDTTSMYRLYYAVDTEKFYMNISEIWEFIGSPQLHNLQGFAELAERIEGIESTPPGTDEELLKRLEALEELVGSGGTPGTSEITLNTYNILIYTSDPEHDTARKTRDSLGILGHTVTITRTLQMDTSQFDVILIVRAEASASMYEQLKSTNKPVLFGLTQGTTGDLPMSMATLAGMADKGTLYDDHTQELTNLGSQHFIAQTIPETFYPYSQTDWLEIATNPAPGTISLGIRDSATTNQVTVILSKQNPNYNGINTAFCGFLYGRLGYSGAGLQMIHRIISWLVQA